MNCPKCGNILRDDAPVCPGCGHVFVTVVDDQGSFAADNGPEIDGLEDEPIQIMGADLRDEKLIKRIMRHRLFYPSVMVAAIVIVVILFVAGSAGDKKAEAVTSNEAEENIQESTEVAGADLGKYAGYYISRIDVHNEWNMRISAIGEIYEVVINKTLDGNITETIECKGMISDSDELVLSKQTLSGKEMVDESLGKLVKLSGNIIQWNNGAGIVFTKSHEASVTFNMPVTPGAPVSAEVAVNDGGNEQEAEQSDEGMISDENVQAEEAAEESTVVEEAVEEIAEGAEEEEELKESASSSVVKETASSSVKESAVSSSVKSTSSSEKKTSVAEDVKKSSSSVKSTSSSEKKTSVAEDVKKSSSSVKSTSSSEKKSSVAEDVKKSSSSVKSTSSSEKKASVAEDVKKSSSSVKNTSSSEKKTSVAEDVKKSSSSVKSSSSSEAKSSSSSSEAKSSSSSSEAKTSSSSSEKKDEPAVLYNAVVNGFDGFVNLRAGASTNDSIIRELPNGTVVEVFSQNGKWLYVRCNGAMGYVAASQMIRQ